MNNQAIETDIVVVGYGSAGATAAITAHDNGAKVIVLEKMPSGGGLVLRRLQRNFALKMFDSIGARLQRLCS